MIDGKSGAVTCFGKGSVISKSYPATAPAEWPYNATLCCLGEQLLRIYRRQRVRMGPLYANSRDRPLWLSDLEQKGDRNLALLIETRFKYPMIKSTGTLGSKS